jgi:hypothetical protein
MSPSGRTKSRRERDRCGRGDEPGTLGSPIAKRRGADRGAVNLNES